MRTLIRGRYYDIVRLEDNGIIRYDFTYNYKDDAIKSFDKERMNVVHHAYSLDANGKIYSNALCERLTDDEIDALKSNPDYKFIKYNNLVDVEMALMRL